MFSLMFGVGLRKWCGGGWGGEAEEIRWVVVEDDGGYLKETEVKRGWMEGEEDQVAQK